MARSAAEAHVRDAVRQDRERKVPWSTIGTYLGTSGEAARQRYGRLTALVCWGSRRPARPCLAATSAANGSMTARISRFSYSSGVRHGQVAPTCRPSSSHAPLAVDRRRSDPTPRSGAPRRQQFVHGRTNDDVRGPGKLPCQDLTWLGVNRRWTYRCPQRSLNGWRSWRPR